MMVVVKYGLVFVYYCQNCFEQVEVVLKEVQEVVILMKIGIFFGSFDIDIKIVCKQIQQVLQVVESMCQQYLILCSVVCQYVEVLIVVNCYDQVVGYLCDQVQLYCLDVQVQQLLVKVYVVQGKQVLQYLVLVEFYVFNGSLLVVIDQLGIVCKVLDVIFYDQLQIDVCECEWKVCWKDEQKELKDC